MMMRVLGVVSGIGAVAMCLAAPAASQLPQRQSDARCEQAAGVMIECVRPSKTDPTIHRFDSAHYVLLNTRAKPNGQLLLFMTGTGGQPPGPREFLRAAADAGYHVISLEYNDDISVAVYCPTRDPACSEVFRAMRIYGDRRLVDEAIDNTPAESIVNRLVKLLQYLDRSHPHSGWGRYVENGAPNWRSIVVCGQSQGAGMAAFIAKEHEVARVILFSSPWDFVRRDGRRQLAPWIALPSQTPPDRWFGGYHARENAADLLVRSYAELKNPEDNIRNEDLPAGNRPGGGNPFHGQGILNRVYAQQWAFFLRTPVR
jgi:hypothetical protein